MNPLRTASVAKTAPGYALSLFLLGGLLSGHALGQAPGEEQGSGAQPDAAAQRKQVASYARRTARLQEFIDEIPRDSFDPAAIVQEVGDDPEALTAWVALETRWVPYVGLLRGSQGVLMDRRGNSLDRSVLLLELLDTAGLSPRLHRGELPEEVAAAVLAASMAQPMVRALHGAAPSPNAARIEVAAERVGIDKAELSREILALQSQAQSAAEQGIARTFEQAESLAQFLDAERAQEARADDLEEAVQGLRDHWWVTLESGEALDPVLGLLGEAGEGLSLESKASYGFDEIDSLPADLFHTFTVSFEVEVTDGGQQKRETALTHTVRASEMVGQSMGLSCSPLDYSALTPDESSGLSEEQRAAAVEERLLACDEWLPQIIVRGRAIEQKSFYADGTLNESPTRGSGRKLDKATGALSGLGFGGRAAKSSEATALYAVYTSRWPSSAGPREERAERTVFDGLGNGAALDRRGKLARALVLGYGADVAPLMATPSEAYVHGLTYATALENRPALIALGLAQADRSAPGARAKMEAAAGKLRPRPLAQWAWGQLRGTYAAAAPEVYVDRPNAMSRFQLLRPAKGSAGEWSAVSGYDVAMNHVGVAPQDGEAPLHAARLRLRQGVADTVLEARLLKQLDLGEATNTSERFAELSDGWTLAQSAPKATKGDVRQDFELGRAVVAPGAGESSSPGCYWRVDPATGAAVGVGPDGRGQVSVENQIALFGILGMLVTVSCGFKSSDEFYPCIGKAACFALGLAVATITVTPFLGGATTAACIAMS